MLEALKFVQGAVARRDFVAALTHFQIKEGGIKGYNGMLALYSPIDLDLNANPKAAPFAKAIQTCKDTVQLNMTAAGRLSVKSGGFRAYIECLDEQIFSDIHPEGQDIALDGHFLDILKTLAPFIAEDASRPWARGILFRGPSAFATNNIILVEKWLGFNFPVEVNIPKPAVQEILRIGEEPERLQMDGRSITFHFKNGRWLRSQTYDLGWPDLAKVLDRAGAPKPIPDGFFSGLSDLAPFLDDLERIFFKEGELTTSQTEGLGAAAKVAGVPSQGCYNYHQLHKLDGVADSVDFEAYPKPCLFYGDKLRGAIVGIRS